MSRCASARADQTQPDDADRCHALNLRPAVSQVSTRNQVWGPVGDHTSCAMVNDLRVCARHARAAQARRLRATWGNVLPLFTGGQVVAGSNPVSPKKLHRSEGGFGTIRKPAFFIPPWGVDSNADSNGTSVQQAQSTGQALDCRPCSVVAGVPVDVPSDRDRGGSQQIGHRFDVHPGLKPGDGTPSSVDYRHRGMTPH